MNIVGAMFVFPRWERHGRENEMKIVRGDSTYQGVVEDNNGNIVCSVCGGTKAKRTMHLDGSRFFTSTYECECGNAIGITTKRDKDDLMYF